MQCEYWCFLEPVFLSPYTWHSSRCRICYLGFVISLGPFQRTIILNVLAYCPTIWKSSPLSETWRHSRLICCVSGVIRYSCFLGHTPSPIIYLFLGKLISTEYILFLPYLRQCPRWFPAKRSGFATDVSRQMNVSLWSAGCSAHRGLSGLDTSSANTLLAVKEHFSLFPNVENITDLLLRRCRQSHVRLIHLRLGTHHIYGLRFTYTPWPKS